jgi:hypothetical protein
MSRSSIADGSTAIVNSWMSEVVFAAADQNQKNESAFPLIFFPNGN